MSNFALAIMAIASMAIPFVNDALGADCTLPAWLQDASGTINTCINNLPTAGGVVTLPAGKYAIANTINMGDGTDSMESTRFAVSLIGAGDGVSSQESGNANAADSGTKLQAINSFTGPMLKVRGPTLNMRIEGIHFNGGGTASGLEIIHSSRSKFERVTVSNYTGLAYSLNTRNTTSIAYGNCNILMLNVNALSPATSTASGMKLDGYQVSGGKDTCGVVAIGGILWYGGGTGSSGIELAFTRQQSIQANRDFVCRFVLLQLLWGVWGSGFLNRPTTAASRMEMHLMRFTTTRALEGQAEREVTGLRTFQRLRAFPYRITLPMCEGLLTRVSCSALSIWLTLEAATRRQPCM